MSSTGPMTKRQRVTAALQWAGWSGTVRPRGWKAP